MQGELPPDNHNDRTQRNGDACAELPDAATAVDLAPGTLIGRYVIVQPLGAGGMSQVMLAHDTQLARRVAVKVLLTGSASEEGRQRMLREAQAMAQLSHPNVVQIFDVGTYDGNVYLAMEYVDGETLQSWLATRRPRREVLAVMAQAGRGLAAAHAAGIVHRDFKPANVILAKDGRVRVLDFGIACTNMGERPPTQAESLGPVWGASEKLHGAAAAIRADAAGQTSATGHKDGHWAAAQVADASLPSVGPPSQATTDKLTQEGAIVGTPGYFAPETAFEQTADARSDIFSFCVTLWRALYGTTPFPSTTTFEYIEAIDKGQPRRPPRGARVPRWLHDAMRRGLQIDPSLRPQSMEELLQVLDVNRWRKRAIASGALFVGVAMAGAVLGIAKHRHATHAACVAEGAAIESGWQGARRRTTETALLAAGDSIAKDRADHALRVLDRYAQEWREAAESSCAMTRERGAQTRTRYEERAACLVAARQHFDTVVDVLTHGGPSVARRAGPVVAGIPSLRLCEGRDVDSAFVPLPADGAARSKALEARDLVVHSQVFLASGRGADATAVARQARALAHEAGSPGDEASALLAEAHAIGREGDDATARALSFEAYALAEQSGFDHIAGLAAAQHAVMLASLEERTADARFFVDLATAKRTRLGADDILERAVLVPGGTVAARSGDVAYALETTAKVIDLDREIFGSDSILVCMDMYNRAFSLQDAIEPEMTIRFMRQAIDCLETQGSPRDPWLGFNYLILSDMLLRSGRLQDSRAAAEHAIALRSDADPRDETRAACFMVLAEGEDLQAGGAADGERDARHAIALAEGQSGWIADAMVHALFGLGIARLTRGDADEARRVCLRGMALQERISPPSPQAAYWPDTLRCLGEAELALGQVGSARAHLEQSLGRAKRWRADELPRVRFALARSLAIGPGADLARARRLGEEACDELRAAAHTLPWLAPTSRSADEWLAHLKETPGLRPGRPKPP